MQEQVQDLISQGRLEDALEVLAQNNVDGSINLQSRFNVGKREHGLGMIDFSEWARVQAQITNSALELLKMHQRAGAVNKPLQVTPTLPVQDSQTTVFISYAYKPLDLDFANVVADYLKQNGLTPRIDLEELLPGDNIREFIINQIRENKVILSLVSENSLRSGWVGLESNLALFAQLLSEKGFVPVAIDQSIFDGDFYLKIMKELNTEIQDLKLKIEESETLGGAGTQFKTKRDRLIDHRTQLDKILNHFQNVRTPDISEDFEGGMQQVVRAIKRLGQA